ncbi:uncharacterized protein LOC118261810 isoform X3 [Spodoptera frugiperda]|uniref:Uncharacterized protein LOC118261810 isoform X2 n=1 Tax=Spodoptera frugiperda TaxID=7108 RepID=A0A9R0F3D1_SPOFR|nr:uncharacterized protein LOC118261810 isoform X2 [Spodoptera frugiperda]XP_050557631.1 uncharacterized protein LOC118261810 isoform X3 [Spodoptera frugiperda]
MSQFINLYNYFRGIYFFFNPYNYIDMLKKVQSLTPSETSSSTDKTPMQCSVCKTTAKSSLYVCESGHVICKSCQKCDITQDTRNECGDNNPDKMETPNNDLMNKVQDLASGDFDKLAAQDLDKESKKSYKEDKTLAKTQDLDEESKKHAEAIIEYKNLYYQETSSSVTSVEGLKITDDNVSCQSGSHIAPRPVMCPVTVCSKMVTIDSFMLHFHFDHSKVPRKTLDDTTPQEISLKASNFSNEVQCVATFIMETQKRSSNMRKAESTPTVRNTLRDNKLLLLMAVKLPINPIKLPGMKSEQTHVFTRSIQTQTEKIFDYDSGMFVDRSKNSSDHKTNTTKLEFIEDEILLLWLCKLDDAEKVFSITLLGEDRRRGYCYLGDAGHVRDNQDPYLLCERSECLMVKSTTVNDLYDLNGHVTVIVSMIG